MTSCWLFCPIKREGQEKSEEEAVDSLLLPVHEVPAGGVAPERGNPKLVLRAVELLEEAAAAAGEFNVRFCHLYSVMWPMRPLIAFAKNGL